MEFLYRTIEDHIEITGYHGQESVIHVPCQIDGYPVTAIGKYAFEGNQDILEVILPDTIESIGTHAFYNCRRMEKMSMSDRITQAEDGAFKNCRSLREFQIRVLLRKMTCLKNLLSELNQELHITMEYKGEDGTCEISRLVFPRYLHDYVDNVEARIINQVTYGSGVHYRECMKAQEVDYRRYDEAFHVALYQDTLKTLFTIARYRLSDGYELSNEAKYEYKRYVEEHFHEIAENVLKENAQEAFYFLLTSQFCNQENADEVLEMAHHIGNTECVGILMDYKNKHWKTKKKEFIL